MCTFAWTYWQKPLIISFSDDPVFKIGTRRCSRKLCTIWANVQDMIHFCYNFKQFKFISFDLWIIMEQMNSIFGLKLFIWSCSWFIRPNLTDYVVFHNDLYVICWRKLLYSPALQQNTINVTMVTAHNRYRAKNVTDSFADPRKIFINNLYLIIENIFIKGFILNPPLRKLK